MSGKEDLRPGEDASVEPGAVYTIEVVARITHLSREEIIVYYRSGFISPVAAEDESQLTFDDEGILQLRRIAYLLAQYEMNREGLHMVSSLLHEVEQLRREVRFLRER